MECAQSSRLTRRSLMSMVCGLDLHRGQITFDALEVESGRGVAGPYLVAGPGPVSSMAGRRVGAASAWRAGELWRWRAAPGGAMWSRRSVAAGFEAHVAEPADTQAARGRKKHAKTDRSDARSDARVAPERRPARERGSRPKRCWSGGSGSGCTRPCSISAECGSSASTPSCSSTAWPARRPDPLAPDPGLAGRRRRWS